MKIDLRQRIRVAVGDVIRQKEPEKPSVLTVTGLVPSSGPTSGASGSPPATLVSPEAERDAVVHEVHVHFMQDLLQRVRYLLTLKGRPPFRLAGLEMFDHLQDVLRCLDQLLRHQVEPRLERLRLGLRQALQAACTWVHLAGVRADCRDLRQAADWLAELAASLDPDLHPARTGAKVRKAWQACRDRMTKEAAATPRLTKWSAVIERVSESYAPGLFYTYDIPGLPRTNNERESEFRDLRRRLLMTTGQIGAVKRILLRDGAWELIPGLNSRPATAAAIAQVDPDALRQERERIQTHRARFRMHEMHMHFVHTRSEKLSKTQLKQLIYRWKALPAENGP